MLRDLLHSVAFTKRAHNKSAFQKLPDTGASWAAEACERSVRKAYAYAKAPNQCANISSAGPARALVSVCPQKNGVSAAADPPANFGRPSRPGRVWASASGGGVGRLGSGPTRHQRTVRADCEKSQARFSRWFRRTKARLTDHSDSQLSFIKVR